MNLKNLLKGLTFSLITSTVFAENKCYEFKAYLKEKEAYLKEQFLSTSTIYNCVTNNHGDITEISLSLTYTNPSEDVIEKLFSYNTITKLEYIIDFGGGYGDEDEYDPKFNILSTYLKNLPNLEELTIHYDRVTSGRSGYHSREEFSATYKNNLLKDLKNLKSLTLDHIKMNNSAFEDINSLTNLESLSLKDCDFDDITLDPLNNNKKLKELYISDTCDDKLNIINVKNIEKLTLNDCTITQNFIDKLKQNDNYIELNFDDVDFDTTDKEILNVSLDNSSKLSKLTLNFYNGRDEYYPYYHTAEMINIKLPKNLKQLTVAGIDISKDNIDEIISIPGLKELSLSIGNDKEAALLDPINNLNNLEALEIFLKEYHYNDEEGDRDGPKINKVNIIYGNFKNLKKLSLGGIEIKETFLNDIADLKNLEELNLIECICSKKDIFDSIGNFSNLHTLVIESQYNEYLMNTIPKSLLNLSNLKILELREQRINSIPEELGNLKNLERLYLTVKGALLPSSLNNLPKLKYITIDGTAYGKTLTNDSLISCKYQNTSLCKAKGMSCIDNEYLEDCNDSDDVVISSYDKCGEGYGKCPTDQCCGKDGTCGTGNDYCYISNGCQIKFGYFCIDQCEELEKILSSRYDKYDLNSPSLYCTTNKEGKAVDLTLYNEKNDDEITKTIGTFDTITKFTYMEYNYGSNYMKEFSKLTNIKDLRACGTIFKDDFTPFTKLENLEICDAVITQDFIDNLAKLPNLVSLVFDSVILGTYIDFESLKKLTNLQSFHFSGGSSGLSLDYIPLQLSTLPNLKTITINNNLNDNKIEEIPKEIGEFKNIEYLDLQHNSISSIPKEIGQLSSLKHLDLYINELKKFPMELASLDNLEYLDLGFNNIDDDIPEYLNNMKNLKTILVNGNENLRGKTLTNPSIENCSYVRTNICIAEVTECIKSELELFSDVLKYCNNDEISTKQTTTTTKISTTTTTKTNSSSKPTTVTTTVTTTKKNSNNKPTTVTTVTTTKKNSNSKTTTVTMKHSHNKKGKCGKEFGKCPSGYCCSKYGYCGKTEEYCAASKGCQSEFGKCNNESNESTTNIPVTSNKNGKCGKEFGKCPSGYCCSKYGYCGKTEEYCAASKGCQSEFGECNNNAKGRCGKENGFKCPNGYCCSKYGWCGTSSDHCAVSKGCQANYGKCVNDTNGKCGPENGYICASGTCCSKYGYCGTGKQYCGSGCQSEFGDCD